MAPTEMAQPSAAAPPNTSSSSTWAKAAEAKHATTDEVIASVEDTLTEWRSILSSPSPSKNFFSKSARRNPLSPTSPKATPNQKHDAKNDTQTPKPKTRQDSFSDSLSNKSLDYIWFGPDAYHRRLSTFHPSTYFAKPLALSPLVCAAFGWENTGRDLIKCQHPSCNATVCISFHPNLDSEARDMVCKEYLNMLATSHAAGKSNVMGNNVATDGSDGGIGSGGCPFRKYAGLWLKAMQGCRTLEAEGGENSKKDEHTIEKKKEKEFSLHGYVIGKPLCDSKAEFYVPPYLLTLSDEFLRFEDGSGDGSLTRDLVQKGAQHMEKQLQSTEEGKSLLSPDDKWDELLPNNVIEYCHEVAPGRSVGGLFDRLNNIATLPCLLSAFGWTISDDTPARENKELVVQCSMCMAQASLENPSSVPEFCTKTCEHGLSNGALSPKKSTTVAQTTKRRREEEENSDLATKTMGSEQKRRRIDAPNDDFLLVNLIESHRVYCPYVSGFSFGVGRQSRNPGWKVVVSNLLKTGDT